jgi:hypothetical protein
MKTMLKSIRLFAVLATAVALLGGTVARGQDTNTIPLTKAEKKQAAKEAKQAAKDAKAAKDRNYAANPTKVKFGEFKAVEIKATEITEKQYQKPGNEKSAAKIDEMLQAQLKSFFPNLKVIPAGGEFSKGNERTLQITPSITLIRIVSTGARVWLGVMAGGSDLVMHVDYRDSSTGEIIANPDFWKGNNAWSGGQSWGASDNQIRDAVVAQIIGYTAGNK